MTPTTNETIENQKILAMELYNPASCSIHNENPAQKKNHYDKNENMTTIPLIRAL